MTELAKTIVFAALLGLCAPLTARAQEINFGALRQAEPNRAHLRTGAEHGFVVGAGELDGRATETRRRGRRARGHD